MPFRFNFGECYGEIQTVTVNPKGWNGPLVIEYGPAQANRYDPLGSVVWRVKGTNHTFAIYEKELNERVKNREYAKHFTEVLEGFREDYLSWWTNKKYDGCEWRDEYKKEFGRLIKPKENNNNKSQSQTH